MIMTKIYNIYSWSKSDFLNNSLLSFEFIFKIPFLQDCLMINIAILNFCRGKKNMDIYICLFTCMSSPFVEPYIYIYTYMACIFWFVLPRVKSVQSLTIIKLRLFPFFCMAIIRGGRWGVIVNLHVALARRPWCLMGRCRGEALMCMGGGKMTKL